MALTLTSEQQAAVERIMRDGKYPSADEALNAALLSLDDEAALPSEEKERRASIRSKSFFQLMQESPLRGIDIEFQRDRSPMRDINL